MTPVFLFFKQLKSLSVISDAHVNTFNYEPDSSTYLTVASQEEDTKVKNVQN